MMPPAIVAATAAASTSRRIVPSRWPRSHHLGQEGAHATQDATELLGQARVGVERLDHERDDEAAMVRHRGVEEAGVDHLAQRRERVARRLHVADDHALELADALGDGGVQQVFLVAEVVVERALGHARLARDALDRRAPVAVAGEAVDRRREHVLARRLRRSRARGAALPGDGHTDRSVQLLGQSCKLNFVSA